MNMNQGKAEEFEKIEKIVTSGYSNIAGVVMLKDGKLLYEKYFNECRADSRIHVFSITKSIVSILIGIALDSHGRWRQYHLCQHI